MANGIWQVFSFLFLLEWRNNSDRSVENVKKVVRAFIFFLRGDDWFYILTFLSLSLSLARSQQNLCSIFTTSSALLEAVDWKLRP